MGIYERIKSLCDERGTTIKALERTLGFSNGSIKKWQTSRPYASRLQAVAEFFGVSQSYLLGEVDERNVDYYLDPDVAIMTQDIKDRPELKTLFDASKKLSKEDIDFVLNMIERMK